MAGMAATIAALLFVTLIVHAREDRSLGRGGWAALEQVVAKKSPHCQHASRCFICDSRRGRASRCGHEPGGNPCIFTSLKGVCWDLGRGWWGEVWH